MRTSASATYQAGTSQSSNGSILVIRLNRNESQLECHGRSLVECPRVVYGTVNGDGETLFVFGASRLVECQSGQTMQRPQRRFGLGADIRTIFANDPSADFAAARCNGTNDLFAKAAEDIFLRC